MRVEAAVLNKLLSEDTLVDLISDRIFPRFAPQFSTKGYVVYRMISGGTINAVNGPTSTVHRTIQIDCISASYETAKQMAEAVEDALNGWTESSEVVVTSCLLESEFDDFDDPVGDSETATHRVIQNYSIWYS